MRVILGGVEEWRKFSVEDLGYTVISTEDETVTEASVQARADMWTPFMVMTGKLQSPVERKGSLIDRAKRFFVRVC